MDYNLTEMQKNMRAEFAEILNVDFRGKKFGNLMYLQGPMSEAFATIGNHAQISTVR